jgi:catechol 2,3-dioxygenase-like lactoylglutathione lyase family enzyme
MANERTYPCLPCRDLDPAIAFYEAIGFHRTYRQLKPNPYAVVRRDDLQLHLFGMPDFDPAASYGNVIVVVPDPDALYRSFADGLRAAFGKIPVAGIPRLLRPRKTYGSVSSFSLVDPGGNWLRVSRAGDDEPDPEPASGLAKIVLAAARLGDSHGDETKALKTLESGLARHPDAPQLDYAKAMLYRAELAVRLGRPALARESLAAAAAAELSADERAELADETERTAELVHAAGP